MKTHTNNAFLLITLGTLLLASTGCATGRLPWLAKKQDTSAMDQYVAQAASKIEYNTDVDFDRDYQSPAETTASFVTPAARSASRSNVSAADSCSSGCCH